ncbi:MAG TPA: VOC family protein [Kofleriaceae bacterium]|nr:VOC family protein [Kofleriaceae bacterium]
MDGAIKSVGHCILHVRDIRRAVAFWRDVIGLEHMFVSDGYNAFRLGDARLALMPYPHTPRAEMTSSEIPCPAHALEGPHANFDLTAEDLEACRDRLVRAGIDCTPIVPLEHAHSYFKFDGPEGLVMTVWHAHHYEQA